LRDGIFVFYPGEDLSLVLFGYNNQFFPPKQQKKFMKWRENPVPSGRSYVLLFLPGSNRSVFVDEVLDSHVDLGHANQTQDVESAPRVPLLTQQAFHVGVPL
jgi:hypothetical protein